MALVELNYFSKVLKTPVNVNVLLPEISKKDPSGVGAPEGEFKTLYLFHGMSSDHTAWIRRTDVDLYCDRYKIAVVMPGVGNSWYTNTAYGMDYTRFVGEELPDVCRRYFRGMSAKREMNFVAGNSMGGYGAVKVALNYPDSFFGCASLSGSLDVTRKGRSVNMELWRAVYGMELESPLELEGTEHDLFHLIRQKKEEGASLPEFFFWCGVEDGLIHCNREFHSFLSSLDISHEYRESEGDHSWKWWSLHLDSALKYFLKP